MSQQAENQLKKTIENLINAGTSFDVDQLELIYHDSLRVIIVNEAGEKMMSNKEAFKELFQAKRDRGDAPLNTWANFIHVEVDGKKGHVVVIRKVNLIGQDEKLRLSIDLVLEDDRWQVTREVIFAQSVDH